MAYRPIEDYGIIGNMRTAALVGPDGSIDWMCYPRFDSPSVFGALLDDAKGGRFRIRPAHDDLTLKQFYWPETNVLVSRFLSNEGVGQVVDFMPVHVSEHETAYHGIVRLVECVRGRMDFELLCEPAFDYARARHETRIDKRGAVFHGPETSLSLATELSLEETERGVSARFGLEEGERAVAALAGCSDEEGCKAPISREHAHELFVATVEYWRHWLAQCTYTGRWREIVHRSALALKLMTYEPTGAIVASPTCSLPEDPGGVRNWDYRYTWIRDAAFTLYGLMRIGFTQEAEAFMGFLEARCKELEPDGSLQIMYGIDGRHDLPETELGHLEGYRGSRPVRVGNDAHDQLQLDICGELLDSVYLYNKYGQPISYDLWTQIRRLVNWVCENWQRPDDGIWEMRSERKHFVYSKVMCWVAVDRALRLADKRSFPAEREHWTRVRDEIYEEIMERGWCEERQAFVQHYDSDALDAANLTMPLVFFLSPVDPRMLKTLEATLRPPAEGGLVANSLVRRYDLERTRDGLDGSEGTFNLCTFWLVEALTRAGRTDPDRLAQARLMFEEMLGYANHLGLYGEETGHRGETLGNFPQAFTHLALISAAFNLDRTLGSVD